MTVSRIEPLNRQKSKVFLDGDFAFALYQGEIQRYQLKEGEELEQHLYEQLYRTAGVRAREKAFSLLQLQARTESELRKKLTQAAISESVIEETVSFLTEYGYLNDVEFAKNYIEIHGKRKSRAELERDLLKKGMDRVLVRESCRDLEDESKSRELIAALLRKRGCTKDTPWKERQKNVAYLMRRGFSWEEIREAADFLFDGKQRPVD